MNFIYKSNDKIKSFETKEYVKNDILYVDIKISFDDYIVPKPFKIIWEEKIIDVAGIWSPSFKDNEIRANWGKKTVESQLARYMPQFTLYSSNGDNRYTIALSDIKNLIYLANGIIEETGLFENEISLFNTPIKPIKEYTLKIRIDRRNVKYYKSIIDCKYWFESLGYKAQQAPIEATEPVYSSWYNFHQNLDQDLLLAEMKIASKLGFKVLIIDDGWQCDDNNRGYGFTGDWNVKNSKFYDLAKFVADCHNLGIKVVLWYSVPFVGYYSNCYNKYKGMYLYNIESYKAAVLDPRFKIVRDYLIDLYKNAMVKYDLDGFKLDFIDAFYLYESSSKEYNDMDIPVLEEAIDRLLKDIYIELSKIKSNVLIEYRQPYIGPIVSSYGNMLRVGDCPYSANTNKREIVNLRLTSGITPVHTDMIMWNKDTVIEDCYRQLYSSLFAVPQISVLLSNLNNEQFNLISNYLNYYNENKEILLKGDFSASTPDNTYCWAKTTLGSKDIVVLYSANEYKVTNYNTEIIYLSNNSYIYLEINGNYEINVIDSNNNLIINKKINDTITKINVPNSCRINVIRSEK